MRIYLLLFPTLIFFLKSSIGYSQVEDFSNTNFFKADSIAQLYPNYPLSDIGGLVEKLTQSLNTEQEKFRAIYKWICLNIENDYNLFRTNKQMREKWNDIEKLEQWNKKITPVVFETLLKKQRTICTGYSYLVKELSLRAGLSCKMVDGYGRSSQANIGGRGILNHTWNAIQLNKKWYLCDATWSSGGIDSDTKTFIKKYNDCYFLLEPELFIFNHYPLDTTWILLSKKPTLQEFLNQPLVYSNLFDYKINELVPDQFNICPIKGKPIQFQFKQNNEKKIEKAELIIKSLGSDRKIELEFDKKKANSPIIFEHTFKNKGSYVVHILLNDKPAYSYTAKIE